MDKKRKEEEDFKAKVMANPEWKKAYGGAWDEIARSGRRRKPARQGAVLPRHRFATRQPRRQRRELRRGNQEAGRRAAAGLSRSAARFAGYRLFSPAPIYPAMEIARMTGALQLDLAGTGRR